MGNFFNLENPIFQALNKIIDTVILNLIYTLFLVITEYFESYNCESFRFGGDEFVLLIEDIQLSYVENLIVKLNEELVNLINVTLSHGCSEVDFNNAKPFHVALKKADAIMYSNKEQYYLNLRSSGKELNVEKI